MSCFLALEVLCAQFGEDVPYKAGLDRGSPTGTSRSVPQLPEGIYRAAVQTGRLRCRSTRRTSRRTLTRRATRLPLRISRRFDRPTRQPCSPRPAPSFACRSSTSSRPGPAGTSRSSQLRHGRRSGRAPRDRDAGRDGRADGRAGAGASRGSDRAEVRGAQRQGSPAPGAVPRSGRCRRTATSARSAGSKRFGYSTRRTSSAIADELGEPAITNGLSLCSIHHRAFDENLIGISPDYEARVAPRLLEDEDGPMLELLKAFDRRSITVPRSTVMRPDRELLATRFEQFRQVAAA